MQTQNSDTAHSLYVLYETLPDEVQQSFLQELLQKQTNKLENIILNLSCKAAKYENGGGTAEEANKRQAIDHFSGQTGLCGLWQDSRVAEEITQEIISGRTQGRDIAL